MRLFSAIVPPPDALEHLGGALAGFGAPDQVRTDPARRRPVRWVEPRFQHVTLAFYGDVGGGAAADLEHQLDAVAGARRPFSVFLAGAGVFNGRVMWAGVGGDVSALRDLMRACRVAGDPHAAQEELDEDVPRAPRPHLTLVRVGGAPQRSRRGPRRSGPGRGRERVDADPGRALADYARALSVYRGPLWCVRDVVLFDSELGAGKAGAPVYREVGRWPLVGPGDQAR